jgi:protoheme ferro-lyase
MRSGPTVAAVCGWPGLAKAVEVAVLRGHRAIVLAELSVGESSAMRAMVGELEALRLSSLGIEVLRTGTLWHSDRIIGMVTSRIARAVADPHVTGVVLVGHGQPPQIAHRNPRMDEEETRFLSRLRMQLVDTGLSGEKVHIAWTDWGEPDVTTSVRHLVAAGCSRVIISPAVYPLDTLATGLDLEIAVRQARVHQSASIVTLPPWKNDPAVIEELRARVVGVLSSPRG